MNGYNISEYTRALGIAKSLGLTIAGRDEFIIINRGKTLVKSSNDFQLIVHWLCGYKEGMRYAEKLMNEGSR